jgi:hypothetical protein
MKVHLPYVLIIRYYFIQALLTLSFKNESQLSAVADMVNFVTSSVDSVYAQLFRQKWDCSFSESLPDCLDAEKLLVRGGERNRLFLKMRLE